MNISEPPEPSCPMTDPSVQMVRSALGREERWSLVTAERRESGSEREQGEDRDRETENEGRDHGGNGGQETKGSREEDGGGVSELEEQKKRQEEERMRLGT